jgi:hypothetical protein
MDLLDLGSRKDDPIADDLSAEDAATAMQEMADQLSEAPAIAEAPPPPDPSTDPGQRIYEGPRWRWLARLGKWLAGG